MRMHAADSAEEAVAALLARMAPGVAQCQENAQRLDREAGFPQADVAWLVETGALASVVPTLMGGLGIGTEAARAQAVAALLSLVGGGSIALGRVFEGHLNAIRLVMRNGDEAQRLAAARDARAGHLHALWVTDGADALRYTLRDGEIELQGGKQFCSAAGHATRAVVTAAGPDGEIRMLLLKLQQGEVARALPAGLQGVRGAGTGRVDFSGVRQDADAVFGAPGAYLAEPEFSAGAWRASAVTVGALAALVDAARAELVARQRADTAEQRQRLGRMFINLQTARLWLGHVAPAAEAADEAPEYAAATVNLGRIAIEAACTETIELVQRSLGLSAFLQSNQVERMCRDIATYLRQPAPDEALNMAAGYFAHAAPSQGTGMAAP
jgi:alkylation response protein AidB-like acyl-CoA dehydrogenase